MEQYVEPSNRAMTRCDGIRGNLTTDVLEDLLGGVNRANLYSDELSDM
jgi:hypothetical protein